MKFHELIDKIPKDIRPKGGVVFFSYVNAFEENFGFFLRDKASKYLKDA